MLLGVEQVNVTLLPAHAKTMYGFFENKIVWKLAVHESAGYEDPRVKLRTRKRPLRVHETRSSEAFIQ